MQNPKFDALTALYSRGFVLGELEKMCLDRALDGSSFGFVFCDIDYFSRFNYTHGHEVGDRMLFRLARMIEGLVNENSFVGRWSGNQFGILVPYREVAEVFELAEAIRTRARDATVSCYGATSGSLTVTIGVACFPSDGASASQLFDEADLAVYAGKLHAKNCVLPACNPWREEALSRIWRRT